MEVEVAKLQINQYLRAIKRHISSKFDSPSSNSLRDITVHTDTHCYMDSAVNASV